MSTEAGSTCYSLKLQYLGIITCTKEYASGKHHSCRGHGRQGLSAFEDTPYLIGNYTMHLVSLSDSLKLSQNLHITKSKGIPSLSL